MLNCDLRHKNVCVTGATGFLGRHLLPALHERGCRVTCLVRNPAKPLPVPVRLVRGDLATGEGLAEALEGQEVVIHMAALLFGLGWQDYLEANARAAQRLAARLPDGVKTVFVSSLAAAGPCGIPPGKNESQEALPVSAYGWSKLLAEKILAASGGRTIILRPPIIYGSGDRGLLPLFRSARRGFAPSPGAGRRFPVSAIHADDVARAICLVAASPKASGIYHLNDGQVHDMDSFCQAMGRALGRSRVRVLHVPLPVMAASACAASCFALPGRLWPSFRPPQWNLDKYRESRQDGWLADAGRMETELGFAPKIDLEQGMAEAVAGYRAEGLL